MNELVSPQPQLAPVKRSNHAALAAEIAWFSEVLDTRLHLYFNDQGDQPGIYGLRPPDLQQDQSTYGVFIKQQGLGFAERIVLIMALLPHLKPQALNRFFLKDQSINREFVEFGGIKGATHMGFLPTLETAAFVLAGDDLNKRIEIMQLFSPQHLFMRQRVVTLDSSTRQDTHFSAGFIISPEYLMRFSTGQELKPDYRREFPAKRIHTQLDWKDLVLSPQVMRDIENIIAWLTHAETIMQDWGLKKIIKPGYRALFYGPPGTGKTLTASLIGAQTDLDVYRIDLSMLVSKYIGETEKNLAEVFDQAQQRRWILFFDEADAVFGRRTQAQSSNDRHANQEIAYLLQRVEDFPGVVILATNLKNNIDEAFARRFQSLIYFPMPDSQQRYRLWRNGLGANLTPKLEQSLETIAEQHELSGGGIINVIRYAAVNALEAQCEKIDVEHLTQGITKELRKEGKTV